MERKLVELGVLAMEDVEEEGSEDEEREASHRRSTYSRDDGATWDASAAIVCVNCAVVVAICLSVAQSVARPVHRFAYVASMA